MPKCSRYQRDSSAGRSAKIMIAFTARAWGTIVVSLRIPCRALHFCDLLVVAHGVKRRVDEPVIAVQSSEECVIERVLFQGGIGLGSELDDLLSLRFESLLDLSRSHFPFRHDRFGSFGLSESRRQDGLQHGCLAFRLLLPS